MLFPTIHINGTNGRDLLQQYCDVRHAVDAALDKLAENGPNGRDYYPQGLGAFNAAILEHTERMAKLRAVRDELEAIAEHIAEFV